MEDCLTYTELGWRNNYEEICRGVNAVVMMGQNSFNMPCHNANMEGCLQTVIRNNFPMLSMLHRRWMVPRECGQIHQLATYGSPFGELCVLTLPRFSNERNRFRTFEAVGNGMALNCIGFALSWYHMYNPHIESFQSSSLLSAALANAKKRARLSSNQTTPDISVSKRLRIT